MAYAIRKLRVAASFAFQHTWPALWSTLISCQPTKAFCQTQLAVSGLLGHLPNAAGMMHFWATLEVSGCLKIWLDWPSLFSSSTDAVPGQMHARLLTSFTFAAGRSNFVCVPCPWKTVFGRFDLWLNSHQLFHMCVVLAFIHYNAILQLLAWRDASGGCIHPTNMLLQPDWTCQNAPTLKLTSQDCGSMISWMGLA